MAREEVAPPEEPVKIPEQPVAEEEVLLLPAVVVEGVELTLRKVSVLENERRVREKECDALREQFNVKMAELANQ